MIFRQSGKNHGEQKTVRILKDTSLPAIQQCLLLPLWCCRRTGREASANLVILQVSDSLLTGAIPWVSYRGYTLGWGTEGYRGTPFLCFHSSVSENGTLRSGELASMYVHLTGEMKSQCWILFQCSSRWGLSVSFLQACGVWPGAETFKVMAMGQYISQTISQSTSQRICPLLRQACPETSPAPENLSWLQSCQEKEPDLRQGPWYALGAGELLDDNKNLASRSA